jgi:hypothetical protein
MRTKERSKSEVHQPLTDLASSLPIGPRVTVKKFPRPLTSCGPPSKTRKTPLFIYLFIYLFIIIIDLYLLFFPLARIFSFIFPNLNKNKMSAT